MNEGFERYRRRHIKTYVCHLRFSLGQLPLVPAVPWTIVWSLCLPSSPHLWPRHPLCPPVSRASVDDNGKCPPSGDGEHKGPLFARLDNGQRSHTVATCHGGEAARCLVLVLVLLPLKRKQHPETPSLSTPDSGPGSRGTINGLLTRIITAPHMLPSQSLRRLLRLSLTWNSGTTNCGYQRHNRSRPWQDLHTTSSGKWVGEHDKSLHWVLNTIEQDIHQRQH